MRASGSNRRQVARTRCTPVVLLAALLLIPRAYAGGGGGKSVSSDAFFSQVAAAKRQVAACMETAARCDPSVLPARAEVQGAPGGAFFADWDWLRAALNTARQARPADRRTAMQAADAHLAMLAAEAGTSPSAGESANFARARAAARTALSRPEFQADTGPTWWERQVAKAQGWILRLFTGMDRLGRRAPWLAPVIEWGCFLAAAVGLLFFIQRSLARQALRISLTEGAHPLHFGDRDSPDWAGLAQRCAPEGNWREAVHALYWAAIASLGSRRAWTPHAARTTRDYLWLLKPGSEAQASLRRLTRTFERAWYGQEPAGEAAYQAALGEFRTLEAIRPERAPTPPAETAGGAG